MALSQRGQRVLAVARRVVELEQELAELHEELEAALDAGGSAPAERGARVEREQTVGGDVQGAVLNELRSRPGQPLRAGQLRGFIGDRAAKGSVESALQRLVSRRLIDRVGRGAYAFRQQAE